MTATTKKISAHCSIETSWESDAVLAVPYGVADPVDDPAGGGVLRPAVGLVGFAWRSSSPSASVPAGSFVPPVTLSGVPSPFSANSALGVAVREVDADRLADEL